MGLYIKQLRAGHDFARNNNFAAQMANFVYIIGDDAEKVCMLVDPAWDVRGLLDCVEREEMKLTGVLVTHYHPDHVGGSIFGHDIAGLSELIGQASVKAHVNVLEKDGVKIVTGLSDSDIATHSGGDEILIGSQKLTLLHTPGHTPGSQCFLIGGALVSGDTLFIGGCGRVDLPGGNAEQLYYSLTQTLGKLPDDTILYPGHDYAAAPTSTIGEEKRENPYMKNRAKD